MSPPNPGRRARRAAAVIAALAIGVALCGCGDPLLWARWRAERAFWHAQREVDRILVSPRVAKPEDFQRAERAFRAITDEFQAPRWGRAGASRIEADVAEVSARSSLALARLAELQSRNEEAEAGYAKVESEWGLLPDLVLEAGVLRASVLERMNRSDEALREWEGVARRFELFQGPRSELRAARVEAGLRVAEGWDARGSRPARDSTLDAEEARYEAALQRLPDGAEASTLLDAVAEVRAMRGDFDGALDAWRRALAREGAGSDSARVRRVLAIGERSLERGRADSARTYARWAADGFQGVARLSALDLAARAWRAGGEVESALAVYEVILSEYSRLASADAEARFQKALLLEALDRWPLARAEFSALCSTHPSHPRALESWAYVVTHHRRAGEMELARIEAEHALAAIGQWQSMQHDDTERGRAREARAAVLLAAGRTREGITELQAVWNSLGISIASAALGEQAAVAARTDLRDPALARSLWQILARRARDPELRKRASEALSRPD